MKNLKKILSLAMAVLMVVGLLAGCGAKNRPERHHHGARHHHHRRRRLTT